MCQPSFKGQIEVDKNDHGDVVVRVNGKEFIADLLFMNQFAVCESCDAIQAWQYHYPSDTIS